MQTPDRGNLENAYKGAIHALSVAQKLTVKATEAKNIDNLIFIVLNDTYHVFPYDRAILFSFVNQKSHLLGVSGQATHSTSSELLSRIQAMTASLINLEKAKLIKAEDLPDNQEDWNFLQSQKKTTVFLVPFELNDGSKLVLWFEKWDDPNAAKEFEGKSKILIDYVIPGYVAAWHHVGWGVKKHRVLSFFSKRRLLYIFLGLLILSFVIRPHLRIVAPCEVVADEPYVIAAPLEGIIEKVVVEPGQFVKKDEKLYEYDARVPRQEFKIAQKDVDVIKSEQSRVFATGLSDDQKLFEMATLNVKLQQAELNLQFAKMRLDMLVGLAPVPGVISMDNPDDWRGKPVKVGERIMVLSNPKNTKIRIWIPEKDNILFDNSIPLKVFLNPTPDESSDANLQFISQEIIIDESQVPSFTAEANWEGEAPEDARLGLKGNCILYGERVSLFYYLLRKPIIAVRTFIGI